MMGKAKPATVISVYIFMTITVIIFLFPYIWMLINSFRPSVDIISKPLALFSGNFTLNAYETVLILGGKSIWMYIRNSFLITIPSVLITLFVCSLSAYALTRKPDLPGFRAVTFFILLSIMYPWALLVIPIYFVVLKLGLLGSHIGIILAVTGGTGIALPFFLFQQFFKTIPYEIIECAEVEGAKELTILTKIIVPMARPVYGTVALIQFMLVWGEWFYVSVLSVRLYTSTLPVGLLNLNSEFGIELNSIMALSSLISLPVIILFLITQKRVMEGIAHGSLKG